MRRTTNALQCDFCGVTVETDKKFTTPPNWLEVKLEVPDKSHPLSRPDAVFKDLCQGCAQATRQALEEVSA